MFAVYSVHFRNLKITLHKQPSPKRNGNVLKRHWNPKMMISKRHLHFCPFSGSIFILGGESRFFQQESAGCLHSFPFGGQESRLRRMRLGFWMNTGLAVGPRRERRRCGTFPENVKSGAFGRLKSHLVSD